MEDPDQFERGTLGMSSNEWLSMVATGRLDPVALARAELANRGASPEGVWVGFEKALRMAAEPVRPVAESPEDRLAQAFIKGLAEKVGEDAMTRIRAKALEWRGRAECPTHDHCDANLVMDDAFHAAMGREADLDSDADLGLIGRAWTAARGAMERGEEARLRGEAVASGLARTILDIPTLETRMSDGLDFHDVACWGVRDALTKAHATGREDGLAEGRSDAKGLVAEIANLKAFRESVVEILQEAGQSSVRDMADALGEAEKRVAASERGRAAKPQAKGRTA